MKLKKIIGLLNDELDGKVITNIVALRSERYSYLIGGIQNRNQIEYSQIKTLARGLKILSKCKKA